MSLSQYRLRRLAPRAIAVWERHNQLEPAIAAHEHRAVKSAAHMIEAYDSLRTHRNRRASAVGHHDEAIQTLLKKMQGWSALLMDDLPGFKRGEYGDNPAVPEDVLSDAQQLLDLVQDEQTLREALPYQDQLVADLGAALEAASAEWKGAGVKGSDFTAMRKEVQAASQQLYRDLIAFRRTLRAHIGRTHPDYKKLRLHAATSVDLDDDAVSAEILEEFQDADVEDAPENPETPPVDVEEEDADEPEAA